MIHRGNQEGLTTICLEIFQEILTKYGVFPSLMFFSSVLSFKCPNNGHWLIYPLIFPLGQFSLSESEENESCHNSSESTSTFLTQPFESWYNPSNWKSKDDSAMPHLHRVPCRYDRVVIPPDSAPKVKQLKKF